MTSTPDLGCVIETEHLSIPSATNLAEGTTLGLVDVTAKSEVQFALTLGTNGQISSNGWRNILLIGESEHYRQPGIYFAPNSLDVYVGWNQDGDDFGQLMPHS